MNILYISHAHPPKSSVLENIGGMQRVSEKLLEQFSDDEEIQVYTDLQQTGWNYIALKTTGFIAWELLSMLYKIWKYDIDVVFFTSMATGSMAWVLRRFTRVPMVTISHGHDVTLEVDIYQWLVPRIFNHIDGVISVSEATRQECLARGLDPSKSKVIPNGCEVPVNAHNYSRSDAKAELGEKLGCHIGTRKVILTVGRLIKRKGHAWFISKVLPKVDDQCMYIIVGGGNEAENIRQLISEYQGKHCIHMAGKLSEKDLNLAYRAADVFVMPNISIPGDLEGFGIVLLEANSFGTPAVASKIEGIQDVISPGKNGFLVHELDAETFAEKVNYVLDHNPEELRKSSRTYVEEHFHWMRIGKIYKEYLKSLLSG